MSAANLRRLLLVLVLAGPAAHAQSGSSCDDAGTSCDAGSTGPEVPLACDGGLCDTTNGSGCSAASGEVSSGVGTVLALSALALTVTRRLASRRGPRT